MTKGVNEFRDWIDRNLQKESKITQCELSKPSKNFDLRKTSTFEKLRNIRKTPKTFHTLGVYNQELTQSPCPETICTAFESSQDGDFFVFWCLTLLSVGRRSFLVKGQSSHGSILFSEFQFENFIFSSLVKCLIMKGFVNIEVTQNFEKISKQMSKNFSGEKGKNIYSLFFERMRQWPEELQHHLQATFLIVQQDFSKFC